MLLVPFAVAAEPCVPLDVKAMRDEAWRLHDERRTAEALGLLATLWTDAARACAPVAGPDLAVTAYTAGFFALETQDLDGADAWLERAVVVAELGSWRAQLGTAINERLEGARSRVGARPRATLRARGAVHADGAALAPGEHRQVAPGEHLWWADRKGEAAGGWIPVAPGAAVELPPRAARPAAGWILGAGGLAVAAGGAALFLGAGYSSPWWDQCRTGTGAVAEPLDPGPAGWAACDQATGGHVAAQAWAGLGLAVAGGLTVGTGSVFLVPIGARGVGIGGTF